MTTHAMPKITLHPKNIGGQQSAANMTLVVPGFNRTISKYCPQVTLDVTLYECLECGDKFALKSSYDMHINRRSAIIEHNCKICRQLVVFYNTCQLLGHARRHKNFSLQVNQENLNDIVVTPLTQREFEENPFTAYSTDITQTHDNYLQIRSLQTERPNHTTDSMVPVNNTETNKSIVNPQLQNTGLLILNTGTQGLMPGLINPFSNHNLILTESGIVAVPNLPPNLSPFQLQAQTNNQVVVSGNITTHTETTNNDTLATTVKTPVKPQVKMQPNISESNSSVTTSSESSPSTMSTSSVLSTESVKKPTVFLKDIGSLLKTSVTPTTSPTQPKTTSSPVVAWGAGGERICVECNTYVKTSLTLREHYMSQCESKKLPSCATCELQLPSKCALSCHTRLHTKLPPFICPDCVIRFITFDQLVEHMNNVCYHLDRRARHKCPLENCVNKLFSNPNAFMKHLAVQHMKSIYKCNLCPIACYTQISLTLHMTDKHYGCDEMPSPYYQCGLCPDRLIPKSRLDQHIEEHAQSCTKINVYLCRYCTKFSLIRTEHITHIVKCRNKHLNATPIISRKRHTNEKTNNDSGGEAKKGKVVLTNPDKSRVMVRSNATLNEGANKSPNKNNAKTPEMDKNKVTVKTTKLGEIPVSPDQDKVVIRRVNSTDKISSPQEDKNKTVTETSTAEVPTTKPIPITNGECLLQKTVITNCYDCKRELTCTFTGENEKSLPIRCPQCYKSAKHITKLPCPGLVKIDPKTHLKVNTSTSSPGSDKKNSPKETPVKVINVTPILISAEKKSENKKENDSTKVSEKKQESDVSDIIAKNSDLSLIPIGKTKLDRKVSVKEARVYVKNISDLVNSPKFNKGKDVKKKKSTDDVIEIKDGRPEPKSRRLSSKESTPKEKNGKNGSPKVVDKKEANDSKISKKEPQISKSPKDDTRTHDSSEDPLEILEISKEDIKSDDDEEESISEKTTKESTTKCLYECAVCRHSVATKLEFTVHILKHRDVHTSYQCMECGLSFMVKPTLQKHLLLRHSLEDVDKYIKENQQCVDKEALRAVLTSIIVGSSDDLKEHQCRICKEQFENAAEHDKHIRVHGMAFLRQKELDKLTAET